MPEWIFAVVLTVAATDRGAVTKCYLRYLEAGIGTDWRDSGTPCALGGARPRTRMEP